MVNFIFQIYKDGRLLSGNMSLGGRSKGGRMRVQHTKKNIYQDFFASTFVVQILYLISGDKNLKNYVPKLYGCRDIRLSDPPIGHPPECQATELFI